MITVLAYFYHPDLGTVRGTVIDGVPMVSYRELSNLAAHFSADGLEDVIRSDYHTEDVTVPVSVDVNGIAKTEKLLFINDEAVYRLLELSAVRTWEKYTVWFSDFVFPMLRQMAGTSEVTEDTQIFYLECTDPKPEKTEMLNNHLFDLFD